MPAFEPLLLSLRLAFTSTVILAFLGGGVAYFLAFTRFRRKVVLESLVALPLALPPTVIGFYFLILFGRESFIGSWLAEVWNVQVIFSFSGLVLGSVIYSFPFMVQPLQTGLEAVRREYREIALLYGATRWQLFWRVLMPLSWRSLLTGCVLTFAHTLGEFGIVMMIGGSIPAETRTASIALYNAVQAMDFESAHRLAFMLLGLCFLLNIVVFTVSRFRSNAEGD
jgi:molybdate transport system permease protein